MSINVNVGANTGPLERDVRAAMDRINRAGGLKVRVDDKGVTQPLGNMKRSADEFTKSLEASNARVLAFGASVGIINAVSNAFKGLVQQTIVVEKNLTDINVVMGLTTQQLDRFGDGLFKVAAETGAGFKVASEAATEFARQGLSVTETLKRTKDALILTRLTGMKAADSVKSLTAAMNTFKGEIKDSTQLVSKFAAVDVKFAVSAEDFAQAIARAGASARDAGVDINELIGVVTAVQERTARGGAVIGNAFKTIFTRIRRSSTLQELENLGIAVRDVEGATLPAMKILQQLAVRYDGLTDAQKSYISQNVAGVFQVNMLKAAMSDLGKANNVTSQATNIASNATDESNRKNEQLRDTMSALATETGVAIQNLAKKIGDVALAPGINKILDGIKGIADFANGILGDGEKEGSRFAKGLLGGIGNFISGPGLVIVTAVVSKLFINAAKYGMQSLQSLLGMNKAATARKHTEQAILQVLASNSALSKEMLRTDISREKKEQMILGLIRQQTIEAQKLAAVSKQLTMPLVRAGVTPNLSLKRADGFIPNFAMDKSERQLAAEGGYAAGAIKDMNIPGVGNVTYNTAEDIKQFPGMTQPAIVPPQGSKAGDNYDLAFQKAHGFSPYASGGFVPNFAAKLPTTHIRDLNKFASDHGFKGSGLYSTAKQNRFGPGGTKDSSFRGGAIYLDANKLLGEPFMNTMGVMVGQGQNTLQKKNYTAAITSIPALRPLVAQLNKNHKGAAANTRVRVGIKEKGLYPVDGGDISSVSKNMRGGFTSTLKTTPGLSGAMDNLADKVREKIGLPAGEVKIGKGSALSHVLGEASWRGYMLEAGVKSALGRGIDTGKESQRAFDLEGNISQGLRDFMGMPLLRALELKATDDAAKSGGVPNKVFNRIFNDYATGTRLRTEFEKRIGMASGAKAASGYVPNFADPLLDAIGREKDSGVPVSKIRVGSHKALRAKSNPMGIGVTNTSDEPNGLKDIFGSGGYVPNYAAPLVTNLGKSGGGIVDKKQSKLLHKSIAKIHREFEMGAIDIKEVRMRLENLGTSTKGVDDSLKLGKGTIDRLQDKIKSTTTSMGQFKAGMQGQGTGMMGRLGRFQGGQGPGKAAFLGRQATGMGGMGAMMGLSMGASFVRGDDPTDKFGQGAGGAMEGASTGMAMGMMFGPLGMAVGAAAGGFMGLISGLDKAEEAAKELAEAQKKAAESATKAAIAFALQNENLNASFAQNAQSRNKYDIGVTEGVKAAVVAKMPGRNRENELAAFKRARGDYMQGGMFGTNFFAASKVGSNTVYESKSGGYTSNRSEASIVDSTVGSTQRMDLFDAMTQLNPKFETLRKSLEDENKTITVGHVARGLSEITPQHLEARATRDGSKTTKELKELDQNTIIKMRHDFLKGIFNTDAEKSAKYNVGTEENPIEKTGQQLLDDLAPKEGEGSKALQAKIEEGTKIFKMIATEGEKALQVQELATAQFIAKLNFEKAQLVSQKSFSDRMHAMNMQTLKTNGSIDANLKLYSNSIAASTRSRLLHDKKENEIENKLQQEKLKASQSYKDSVIGFLNNDGGTGIGQELKNAINDPKSMENISAVLGEDIAKQFEKAKGQAGEMEEVLARLTNEQLEKLLSNLNEQVLSNSKITDFLDIQEEKLKNQNTLADNNAAIARKKLSIEQKTNAILDARAEKLKNINIEMERIRNASKFISEAAGLIVGNADLDSQISLARMGGGTQRQQFAASQASAQRKFISQKMLREQSQRDQLMGSILQNSTFRDAGLLDSPDLSAEKLTQMTPEQLIAQVKSSAATRSTGLNEQLNQERFNMQYATDPTIPPDQDRADEIKRREDNIRALETQINLQQQASQEADKIINNITQQVKQNQAINGLYDEQYQKMKQLAQIQHEFVYGDNAFANGMNKAFADAQDRADRFKYDLGEALPQSFSRNMSQALSDIVASGDFEEGMLNAGLNFFKELNQMFTQNIMDQMMGAMLGDGAKSEQQQQIETTRQLKNTIEGTLSRSIDRLSTSVDSLASSVQTMPAKEASKPEGSGLGSLIADFFKYQGGPIRMNTGGQVPAMLTSGEFVMNKRAVSKLGKANMDLLNQGHIPRFSEGGAAFASSLGSSITAMGMNYFQDKLNEKEAKKNKKWERGKDAFEQNRAYKRNRMSAFYMQNSSDVQQEVSEIRMRKEQELQKWIDKQNKKQQLGRQIVSAIGNAAVAGLGASLGSSTGIGSSKVKDAQGNVIKNAQGEAQRQSFFAKADNTLGYKSFFADTSRTIGNYSFNRAGGSDALRQASMQRKSANSDRMNQGMNNHVQAFYEQNYQNAVKSYVPVHKAKQLQGAPYPGFNSRKEYEQSNRFMFNAGGKVTGPSGIDRVPAMLTEGEYVINARAARKIGMPALESINAGKYNEGGLVKDSTAKKPGQPGDSKGMTNNISINVTVNGSSTSEDSEKSSNDPSDQRAQMDDLGKKIKQQVITVIREENRPGGLLGK